MKVRFADLPPGAKFVCPTLPRRVCIKLSYPPGSQPDCNAADLSKGLRLNLKDDELCEVRE